MLKKELYLEMYKISNLEISLEEKFSKLVSVSIKIEEVNKIQILFQSQNSFKVYKKNPPKLYFESIEDYVLKNYNLTLEKGLNFVKKINLSLELYEVSKEKKVLIITENLKEAEEYYLWIKLLVEKIILQEEKYEAKRNQEKKFKNNFYERQKNQLSLMNSEYKYLSLIENITEGFIVFNILEKSKLFYKFEDINSVLEEELKIKKEDLKGKYIESIFPEINKYQYLFDKIKIKKKVEAKIFFQSLERYYKIIAYKLNEKTLNIIFINITKEVLERNHLKKLSVAIEQNPSMIIIMNKSGIIEYSNPKVSEVTKYSKEELKGKSSILLKSKQTPFEVYEWIVESINSGQEWKGEILSKKKNGEEFWERIKISPIKDERGKLKNYIRISEDITLTKAIEKELIEARQKAENANKIKSEFISNISHELRTPMNGIVGPIDLLFETKIDEEQNELLEMIKISSIKMIEIVNSVLDILKIETNDFKIKNTYFNLKDKIGNLLKFYEYNFEINKNLKFYFEFDKKIPLKLYGDPFLLVKILKNLLSNAIKFTREGSITLKVLFEELKEEKLYIKIILKDTGIGISKENKAYIFNKFTQVDGSYTRRSGGTGIGLAIVKELVEKMNGKIELSSELGKGSEFKLSFYLIHS